MAKTTTVTFDSLSAHAVVAPVSCQRVTLRESAADASPVSYTVFAPTASDPGFVKYPAEATVFAATNGMIQAGDIVGYAQPASGTVTFTLICE
jgi:hypothetical protein